MVALPERHREPVVDRSTRVRTPYVTRSNTFHRTIKEDWQSSAYCARFENGAG